MNDNDSFEGIGSKFNPVPTSANSFAENQVQSNATLTDISIQSNFPIQQSNNVNAATGNPSYSRAILTDQQTPTLPNVENLQLVVGNAKPKRPLPDLLPVAKGNRTSFMKYFPRNSIPVRRQSVSAKKINEMDFEALHYSGESENETENNQNRGNGFGSGPGGDLLEIAARHKMRLLENTKRY